MSDKEERLVNSEIIKLIKKYGYLLSSELYLDFIRLSKIQEEVNAVSNLEEEYASLRERVINAFEKEFNELQSIYSDNFETHKIRFKIKWYIVTLRIIRNTCIIITLSYYVILALNYYYKWTKSIPMSGQSELEKVIYSIYALIMVITTLLGFIYVCILIFKKMYSFFRKIKKYYMANERVPMTALYKCRICGEIKKLNEHRNFPYCTNQNSIKNFFKSFYIFSEWKLYLEKEMLTEHKNKSRNCGKKKINNNAKAKIEKNQKSRTM